MRVCPKCGFEDPPYWRKGQGDHYGDMDICRIEDLDENQPEVAKALREHGEFFDDYYAYRLTKPRKIWVKRRWIGIYKFQGGNPYHMTMTQKSVTEIKLSFWK